MRRFTRTRGKGMYLCGKRARQRRTAWDGNGNRYRHWRLTGSGWYRSWGLVNRLYWPSYILFLFSFSPLLLLSLCCLVLTFIYSQWSFISDCTRSSQPLCSIHELFTNTAINTHGRYPWSALLWPTIRTSYLTHYTGISSPRSRRVLREAR